MSFSTVVSVVAIYEVLVVRSDDRLDAALQQEVEEFRSLASGVNPETGDPFGANLRAIFDLFKQRNVPGPGETIVMFYEGRYYDERSSVGGGKLTLGGEAERWAQLRRPESGEVETPTETIRYLAVPVQATGATPRGVFVVAASLSAEREDVWEAVQLATLVLITVLLIASALAWVVAGRLLAPLRTLDDTARSITETDLTRRIPVSGSDEIAELSRTFNAMVDRLEGAFASQRAFVSDASHELRTPITIVRGHLELLGDDPDERRETVALVTDELDRMSRFVDDLLLLAKAERSDFLRVDKVELGALTDELLDKAAGLGKRRWALEARGEAVLHADRQRLTQAVMGLAQNAVQHTQDGDAIWIGTGVDGEEASLWVRDSGPGVAREDQDRIFDRFARAAGSRRRSEGAGLGLAIVRAIADAHGGRATLSSQPGAGSTFTVVVPLSGPEVSR
ncbi:HAMP domain-containing protein [Solirubrobacter sp. CPCC 204708]|nr:HAMP domain-containing protein [Solirubrobacter deserti]